MRKPFAIVTGASSRIARSGRDLRTEGLDLLVVADRPQIQAAAERFRSLDADVTVMETDLDRGVHVGHGSDGL